LIQLAYVLAVQVAGDDDRRHYEIKIKNDLYEEDMNLYVLAFSQNCSPDPH